MQFPVLSFSFLGRGFLASLFFLCFPEGGGLETASRACGKFCLEFEYPPLI